MSLGRKKSRSRCLRACDKRQSRWVSEPSTLPMEAALSEHSSEEMMCDHSRVRHMLRGQGRGCSWASQ